MASEVVKALDGMAIEEFLADAAIFWMRYQAGYGWANARRRARERGEAIVRETRKVGALL